MAYQMRRGAAPKFRELGSSNPQPGDSPNKNALQGAATGAKLGATLGTVVPGVGNVVGGIIGGVGGAIWGGVAANRRRKREEEEQEALLEAQKLQDAEKDRLLAKLAVERKSKEDGWRGFSGSEGGMSDAEAARFS